MSKFDNKIVNLVSTLGVKSLVNIERRVGSKIRVFTTEQSVKKYQMHMGGVDKEDQLRELGAKFCNKAHFKKWYKKTFFAVLDFMLLNSYIGWQLASEQSMSTKKPLEL